MTKYTFRFHSYNDEQPSSDSKHLHREREKKGRENGREGILNKKELIRTYRFLAST